MAVVADQENQFPTKVLSGDRATGALHLGHYLGSLQQRVALQQRYPQTLLIADLQGLTDNAFSARKVGDSVLEIVADYLAVGIDPQKTTICLQSALPALAELSMYYANLVSVARLERNPTVKTEIRDKAFGRAVPVGFLTYPISQAADITAFKATLVPVGEDQLPMLELTNEIVKKLNGLAGGLLLPECRPLLSKVRRLPGTDGKHKMSKSMGNAILLSASEVEIAKAVKSMYTDPEHLRVEQPGRVEGNVVFTYLDAVYPDADEVAELKAHYRRGGLADSVTKSILEDCLQDLLRPIREQRQVYAADKAQLLAILREGSDQAQEESQAVLHEVKAVFGLNILDQARRSS